MIVTFFLSVISHKYCNELVQTWKTSFFAKWCKFDLVDFEFDHLSIRVIEHGLVLRFIKGKQRDTHTMGKLHRCCLFNLKLVFELYSFNLFQKWFDEENRKELVISETVLKSKLCFYSPCVWIYVCVIFVSFLSVQVCIAFNTSIVNYWTHNMRLSPHRFLLHFHSSR